MKKKGKHRGSEWWNRLTKAERSEITMLERAVRDYGLPKHAPDVFVPCGYCGTETSGGGLCLRCRMRRDELIEKGDGE